MKFKESKAIKSIMNGLKPCVVGLIGSAVISMGLTVFAPNGVSKVIVDKNFIFSIMIFGISLLLVKKKVNPIAIICLSAVIGIVCGILWL